MKFNIHILFILSFNLILSSCQDDPIEVLEDQLEGVWYVQSWNLRGNQIIDNGEVDFEYWQELNVPPFSSGGPNNPDTFCVYTCPLELNFQQGSTSGFGNVGLLDSCLHYEINIDMNSIYYGCEYPASYVLSNDGHNLDITGLQNTCSNWFPMSFHEISFNQIEVTDNQLIMSGNASSCLSLGSWVSEDDISIVATR